MQLHRTVTGTATGAPRLVIAHGLFGSSRNWGAVARALARGREVVAVDLRNHGQSPWAATHRYPDLAADLAGTIEACGGGPADVLGHSMGGKAAMALALLFPARVRRLVVADIAPVAYGHDQTPLVDALRATDLAGVTTRAEADRRLAARLPEEGVRGLLLQSLELRGEAPRWRLNLDVLAAEMDGITGWPELPGRFDGPALFLAGAASDYVTPDHDGAIRARFPAARIARIAGAGHWLQADRPAEVVAAVQGFLDAP
ncbi:MAG: alpha/beta fold hydrolase [Rhodobacteraceae bacterium]|nr:alpha/beta fold hydrolase [Paracoccaceae bacterium]